MLVFSMGDKSKILFPSIGFSYPGNAKSDSEPPLNCRENIELKPEDELTLPELKYLPPDSKLPRCFLVPLTGL